MKSVSEEARPRPGLRERKKAKTKAAIQQHALRLFREQGYAATTVEQIAEAAEISPSTFFRYFPTKEDVVLYDDLDPLFIAAFDAQPPALSPIQALRGALRQAFSELPEDEMAQQWERVRLALDVPELRRRLLDQVVGSTDLLAGMVAKRVGRPPDDLAVRTFAGAVIGALLAVIFTAAGDPAVDFITLIDDSLIHLEAGLPL